MKFFSELGSCYRPSTSATPPHLEEEDRAIKMVAPLPSSRRHHAERKNKLGGGGSASSAGRHWRPSLQAIREDVIGLNLEDKIKIIEKRRAHSENKSKGRYTSTPHRVSRNDKSYSWNNNSEPMVLPAFSPTPFTF